jgi:hypothetical protein
VPYTIINAATAITKSLFCSENLISLLSIKIP